MDKPNEEKNVPQDKTKLLDAVESTWKSSLNLNDEEMKAFMSELEKTEAEYINSIKNGLKLIQQKFPK